MIRRFICRFSQSQSSSLYGKRAFAHQSSNNSQTSEILARLPRKVNVVEVGPRDGLQNEKQTVTTADKVEFIHRLQEAGASAIETASFVSPKWVPQMADGADVMKSLKKKDNISYQVLTPNLKGYDAAVAAGAREVAVFGSASESFSLANINCTREQSVERFRAIVQAAQRDGVRVRGYVSCVLGCPYEGDVPHAAVEQATARMLELGCYEVSLGDTIGVGTAGTTDALLRTLLRHVEPRLLAVHLHDTYGQALANILVALQHGITTLDSSAGGLGGCPYAPAASGNVATEDVVYMLDGLGIHTGLDLDKLTDTSHWMCAILGKSPASQVATAIMAKRLKSKGEKVCK